MAVVVLGAAVAAAACVPPAWGAHALLHPYRKPPSTPTALAHRDVAFWSGGATFRGWLFPAAAPHRAATVVYLHGIADDRSSGSWIAERLVPLGLDVLAYDGRAQGQSGGSACTYGVLERRDLSRALDEHHPADPELVGVSLGAAIALEAAPEDPRIAGVVAVSTFSDLTSIARDRAPWFMTDRTIQEALALAEREGGFHVADASPVAAAPRIRGPVLVVHGADDRETRPEHSRRVYDALAGPKRLVVVDGARHDDALGRAWGEVEPWILEVVGGPVVTAGPAPAR